MKDFLLCIFAASRLCGRLLDWGGMAEGVAREGAEARRWEEEAGVVCECGRFVMRGNFGRHGRK